MPESVLGMRLLKRGYVAQYEYGKAFVVHGSHAGVRRRRDAETARALRRDHRRRKPAR